MLIEVSLFAGRARQSQRDEGAGRTTAHDFRGYGGEFAEAMMPSPPPHNPYPPAETTVKTMLFLDLIAPLAEWQLLATKTSVFSL